MHPNAFQFLSVVFVVTTAAHASAAQNDLPVLRSNSKTLSIIDGDHVKQHFWAVIPERKPDVYYVEIPRKSHTVTFRSDVAEISFPMTFGERADFIVLLNDETRCHTQIRAEYKQLQPFSLEPATARAEIPFTVGDNDKIYVLGRLNGGQELRLQFDLGCGGSIIKKSSAPLAKMQFDGSITLSNSDGVQETPSSSSNHLQLGALHWRDLPFAVADNMTHREDGLLGNTLFQDQIVEIDYDRGVIAIHDTLPALDASYSKHAIVLDGVVPFIQGSLELGGMRRDGWFMFDTGAYTSILFSDTSSPWSKFLAELRSAVWWSAEGSPHVSIGKHSFSDFNYTVRNQPCVDDQLGLLGNDMLKRFNVVLDNQNGFIYLQPNSRAQDPYANPEYFLARGILVAGMLLAAGVGIARRRRRRSGQTESVGQAPPPKELTSHE